MAQLHNLTQAKKSTSAIRVGIIGAGSVGRVHAEAIARAGQQIAGFCDVDLDRAEDLNSRFGDSNSIATTSLDKLLAQPETQAVVVGVPNYRHKDVAIAAIRAGKDVLLEKPMAMTVAECDEILKVHRVSKQILQMGFVSRQSPTSRAALDFINSGSFGRIYHIKAALIRRRGIPGLGGWFTTKQSSGGGALIDIGVHLIDLVLHLVGSPRVSRVSAVCNSALGKPTDQYVFNEMWAGPPVPGGDFDVEDSATALMRFDSGATFELNVAWASNIPEGIHPNGVTIFGDNGGCYLDVWGRRMTMATEQEGHLVDVSPQVPEGNAWEMAWTRQHELFARTVRERTPPVATGEQGRYVQVVLEALYRSSFEKREVEICE